MTKGVVCTFVANTRTEVCIFFLINHVISEFNWKIEKLDYGEANVQRVRKVLHFCFVSVTNQ